MNEKNARNIAEALGGEAWHSGGGIWVVSIHRKDGKLVIVSSDVICEYANEDAFNNGEDNNAIYLY